MKSDWLSVVRQMQGGRHERHGWMPEGIGGPGLPLEPAPFSAVVPAARDASHRPTAEGEHRFDGFQMGVLSATVDPEAISVDGVLLPFWNARCAERQSMW